MDYLHSSRHHVDPSVHKPLLSDEQQHSTGQVNAPRKGYVNLILVEDDPEAVHDGVQGKQNPPVVPANHVAVHVPSDKLDLKELSSERFEGAEAVYMAARSNPEESLYAKGKYWFGRMKNWMMLRPNTPLIEGVDQTFWGFSREVAGAGWDFIYDQLKCVRAYGTGLFGLSSDVKKLNAGNAQIQLYNDFKQLEHNLAEAVESEFAFIDNEWKAFVKAKKENDAETLAAFAKKGITSEEEMLAECYENRKHVVEILTTTLHRAAVSMNPDYVAQTEKLSKIMEQVSSLEAQLAIAKAARDKVQERVNNMSLEIGAIGNVNTSWKTFDRACAKLDVEKAKCDVIERKLKPLKEDLEKAARRFKQQEEALLKEEGRFVHASLEADAELGELLANEALSSVKWTVTWSVNDLLKTLQYACTGLGVLGIPVVSPIALGASFVTGSLSLLMYGEDTVHRGREAHHARRVGGALDKIDPQLQDAELGAIHSLIEKNLSYKGKSIKAFFTSLGIVSTVATLGLALANTLAIAGVISASAMTIISPVGWGIGGICLAAGLAFGAYSGAKAIYRLYKEYKTESLLEEALEMRDDLGKVGSNAYNQLFMETLKSVDEVAMTHEEHEKVKEITTARIEVFCNDREAELERLAGDVENYLDSGREKTGLYSKLFDYYMNVYFDDALNASGYDDPSREAPITSAQRKNIEGYINNKINEWIDRETENLEAIKGDLREGTLESYPMQDKYCEVFRIVMSEFNQGAMRDRIKVANDRIIEQSMLKLMEQRPDYGLRILAQRIREGDEAAIKFVEDLGVFKDNELLIIKGASVAAESRVVDLMMKRLGFDT